MILIGALWFILSGGLKSAVTTGLKAAADASKERATNHLQAIQNQVAEDAAKQYEIAKRNGSKIDAFVHAQLTAAAYLQAQDEVNYQKWKAIEAKERENAGMPKVE